MTKLQAEKLFRKWQKELAYLGVSQNVDLKFSNLKRSCGRCRSFRNEDFHEITISNHILDNDTKEIENTIIHELLHTIAPEDHHGGAWKESAQAVNAQYGFNIKRLADASKIKATPKYIIGCKKCQARHNYYRMGKVVKNPDSYTCGCGGELERVK